MRNVSGLCWLSVVVAVGVSGCASLVGDWESSAVSPEMARDQFRLIRSDNATGEFIRARVTFKKDDRYVAEVYHQGGNTLTRGSWAFSKGKLTLNDDQFGEHVYAAELDGKTLRIVQPIKGTDVVLTMTRRK